ncbi:MAG: hypothetical protein QXG86_00845 [Candidatus Woesearchaeota archaeon]
MVEETKTINSKKETKSIEDITGIKILIVDKDQLILNSLRRPLKWEGYEVFTADNLEKAVSILNKTPDITLVISGFWFGHGQDSSDFLRYVSKNWPYTRRILYTGYPQQLPEFEEIAHAYVDKLYPQKLLKEVVPEQVGEYMKNTRKE